MGGIAVLAKQEGHRVTGCDANVYPPMSTQLEAQGIELIEGFSPEQTKLNPDIYVIGNVVSRGNPLMEEILNQGLPYISGHNGLRKMCCKVSGCLLWQVRMVKPQPVLCWRGCWSTQVQHQVF